MNNNNSNIATTTTQERITELIKSLEQATSMAKQLQSTTTTTTTTTTTRNQTTHLLQIYSSLHHSHHLLSSFLSHSYLPISPPTAETSLSSATGAAEPMQIADDDDDTDVNDYEQDSSNLIMMESVEERMRECFIKSNKRPKRPLSPTAIAAVEERRLFGNISGGGGGGDGAGAGDGVLGFDPFGTKLRALELIYQFHG